MDVLRTSLQKDQIKSDYLNPNHQALAIKSKPPRQHQSLCWYNLQKSVFGRRVLNNFLIVFYTSFHIIIQKPIQNITQNQSKPKFHKSPMGSSKSSPSPEDLALQKLKRQLQQKNNHLNHLRKQNHALLKQNIIKSKPNKQYTIDDIVLMNYAAFTCIVCQNSYDQHNRVPIMICKNQHTICQPCCKQKQAHKEKKCVQCNQGFQNLGKNRSILQLITNKEDLLKWVKQRDAEMQEENHNAIVQAEMTEKTIVKLCRFHMYPTMFEMNGDSLLKISPQNSWHTIRSQDYLPVNKQCQVSFKVVFSACNSIIVGVTVQNQEFQKGFIPSNSLAYHLNNGHIFDLQDNTFKWRPGGPALAKNTNPRVLMSVHPLERKIKWKINNKLYGETQIPDRFLGRHLYLFIAIYHKDDIVVFNK